MLAVSDALQVKLPRDPSCAAITRRLLEQRFRAQLSDDVLSDVKTIASELVNNAYIHGVGSIELRAEVIDHRLRIAVIDEGDAAAVQPREPRFDGGGGHGLQIVGQLSGSWGVQHGTTHVWAELPIT